MDGIKRIALKLILGRMITTITELEQAHRYSLNPIRQSILREMIKLDEKHEIIPEGQQEFEIWSEGFAATGESGPARFHGTSIGIDFKDSCIKFSLANPKFLEYFDSSRMTYWGCELFDNEIEARKSFG